MIGCYSAKRKTNRWPSVVFANMIDISALNAYILYSEINPSWTSKDQTRMRPEFLRKLALSLAEPHMMKRTRIPQHAFSAQLLKEIRVPSSLPENSSNSPTSSKTRKRGICNCCKSKSDIKCSICTKFICKNNKKTLCFLCDEKYYKTNN